MLLSDVVIENVVVTGQLPMVLGLTTDGFATDLREEVFGRATGYDVVWLGVTDENEHTPREIGRAHFARN